MESREPFFEIDLTRNVITFFRQMNINKTNDVCSTTIVNNDVDSMPEETNNIANVANIADQIVEQTPEQQCLNTQTYNSLEETYEKQNNLLAPSDTTVIYKNVFK